MMTGNSDRGFTKGRPLLASVVGFFEEMTSSAFKRTPRNVIYLDYNLISDGVSQPCHCSRAQRQSA